MKTILYSMWNRTKFCPLPNQTAFSIVLFCQDPTRVLYLNLALTNSRQNALNYLFFMKFLLVIFFSGRRSVWIIVFRNCYRSWRMQIFTVFFQLKELSMSFFPSLPFSVPIPLLNLQFVWHKAFCLTWKEIVCLWVLETEFCFRFYQSGIVLVFFSL